MDPTVQSPEQAPQNTAPLLAMPDTLLRITNLNIPTLNYWPVRKVLEAAAVFISAVTPGVLVASEVHRSSQLAGP
jgi:hypothetical protein